MFRVAELLVLACTCIALVSALPTGTYEGYGTVYTLSTPSSGNCNFMSWPSDATTKYAALNAEQWEETMNCGRCAEVWCTDSSCASQSSEIVYIMDQCPGCEYGDLDLSPDVFEGITGQSYTKLGIEWKFVDCPISKNVEYCLKTGSSEFWVAIQPANFVSGVQSLKINGQETTVIDSAYYFLIDGSGESVADLNAVSISLTGVNGEVLEETVSLSADACTEGSSQFSYSEESIQTSTTTEGPAAETSSSPSPTPTQTLTPTSAPIPSPTPSQTPIPTPTQTPSPIPTSTPTPMQTPTPTPIQTPTQAPSRAPTSTPMQTTSPTPTPIPAPAPTQTPTPTPTPIRTPQTPSPTSTPTLSESTQAHTSNSTTASVVGSLSTSSSAEREGSPAQPKSLKTPASNSTSPSTSNHTDVDKGSSTNDEEDIASMSTSATTETSAPISAATPTPTEASVQEAASSGGGIASTGAIVGLVVAVCVAVGASVGMAVVVRRKRKLLEERKNLEDRLSSDSLESPRASGAPSYASVVTPRSEVPVMHQRV
ncbi:hypothetical protein PHYBOEH_007700 [Phytophthora boehmeriae]|uniref:Expansin-like EG45 domain-containing protein n=1 Tax=Phytophthora boehmeriae TaxID=109152 RepID=A0A8T1W5B6_9STRA|nr:hypothetical protein PHYBOEH_007700 [Phytophthora boehmeriae]